MYSSGVYLLVCLSLGTLVKGGSTDMYLWTALSFLWRHPSQK